MNHAFGKSFRRRSVFVVVIPLLGFCATIIVAFKFGIRAEDVIVFFIMCFLSTIGIEVGFHRYFAHQSFHCSNWVKYALGILGSMAAQGPLFYWASTHRRHHIYSDEDNDPHSPSLQESGIIPTLKGLWHAHVGWIFSHELSSPALYVKELVRDQTTFTINRFYLFWVLIGLIIPAGLVGIIQMSWFGVLTGFLWGGLTRIFIVQHVAFSINSFCHYFGTQSYKTNDNSKNNLLLALPTLGGAWHNNHHAFPGLAIIGYRWWEIDISGWFIRLLKSCGCAWDVKEMTHTSSEVKAC